MSALSIILPASNEAALIGGCLTAVLGSNWSVSDPVEVIVVANGCRDDTAAVARGFAPRFEARGWRLFVIERAEGGKIGALNAGDSCAVGPLRVYLDADVTVSPPLLAQIAGALARPGAAYASGRMTIPRPRSPVSRAYARIYRKVPFLSQGVPGCGFFAVNAAGRARWGDFPQIISDDTFVRLCFAPQERHLVAACYDWPLVEGWRNLVRVRRRQDAGVAEVRARFPHLTGNEDTAPPGALRKLAMALRDPVGFATYAGVALAVRLTPAGADDWTRGR